VNGLSESNSATDDKQQTVFVGVIPLTKQMERGSARVRSCVRLYRPDEMFSGHRNALYRSAMTGFFEFFGRGANGKLVAPRWSAVLFFDQCADQVVQAGPKLIDDFSDQDSEAVGHGKLPKSYEDVISTLVLELADNAIWAGIREKEGANFTVEILDVFFGPLNLGSNRV